MFHAVLNVHPWCKPCASQKLTTPVFQLPTFAPLDLNGDSKWHADVNAFLLDHDPSQAMDFYCIFENDRGLNTALSPTGSGNDNRNGGGKEGGNGIGGESGDRGSGIGGGTKRICQYILELEMFQSNLYGPDFSAT
jgi:hypothetical protein